MARWRADALRGADHRRAGSAGDLNERTSQDLNCWKEHPMQSVHGLHHITAIAGPAQENLDFYAGILGMRLVKRSVNQDDPGTYHLFYADAEGHPGSDLTFFPWAEVAPPLIGHGLAVEVALEVPARSLDYWFARLSHYGTTIGRVETRFAERVL